MFTMDFRTSASDRLMMLSGAGRKSCMTAGAGQGDSSSMTAGVGAGQQFIESPAWQHT